MAPLVYVMAILGCGDDGTACSRERIAPASYASVTECRAAMPAMLARSADLSFPVITAQCERGDAQVAKRQPAMPQRNS